MVHGKAFERFATDVIAALIAVLALFLPGAAQAEAPRLTIVMDGSGSMWGKLGGERLAKFQLVRQGLAEALPKFPAAMPLALVAYGHRRTGCQDTEILRAPETGDPQRILDLLNDFNPKGRGPIAAGLETAIGTIPKGNPGTVLLVHDDLDNCQQDPCALMDGIRSSHPRLVIHVLSIGLSSAEARPMQCLTAPTRGQHYVVANGAQLTSAISEILEIAARIPGAPPTTAITRQGDERPPDTKLPVGPGLHLVASLGQGTVLPDLPVRWRIERIGVSDSTAVVHREGGGITLPVPPGRYVVTAELDRLVTRQEVDVADARPIRVQMALAGGTLRFSALAGRSSKPLEGTRFIIRPLGTENAGGKTAPQSWIARGARPEVGLPEGRYEVVVVHDGFRMVQEVTVVTGERRPIDVRLPVGELELAALQREGGTPIDAVTYVVHEDDPNSPQGRREVARSAAARPVLALPAGTYHVSARHGAAEARDRVAIAPGEVVRRDMVLNSAVLDLTSGLAARQANAADEVQWRIVPLERPDGKPVRAYGATAQVVLSAGRYRIEARFGPLNAEASREIVVPVGAREAVTLTPPAAHVRLRLAPETSESTADIFWKVRLADGTIVWSSTETEPVGLLQQGRYLIEVQTRGSRQERTAEIAAGTDRVVVVGEN